MKVILLEDVRKQGKKGDVITVSPGYGRNYLVKRGLAKVADQAAMNQLRAEQRAQDKQDQEELAQAKETKAALEDEKTIVEIKAKAGDDGRLFGAVTSKQIADALKKQYEIKVDRRRIQMEQNLQGLGYYSVPIRLYTDVDAMIRVHVAEE